MEELLTEVLKELGGDGNMPGLLQGSVEISKLKAADKVRSYFRRTFFRPPWEDDTWAIYFQSRSEKWDYNDVTKAVKMRSELDKQIEQSMLEKRKKAPFPADLYTAMLRSGTSLESSGIVSQANPNELAATPIDQLEALLGTLGEPLGQVDPAQAFLIQAAHVTAQTKLLACVPGALEKKGADLAKLMDFFRLVLKFGGDQADPKVTAQRLVVLKEICAAAAVQLREKGLGAVVVKNIQLLCQMSPFHVMALAVAALGEKGDGDDVKECASILTKVPATTLEGLAEDTLLRLAMAATKSKAVAEAVLGTVAKAAAATLPAWNMDDVTKLLMAMCKAKAGTDSPEVTEFYGRVAEALSSKLATMTDTQLIKVTLVLGRIPSCKDFLEALAENAVGRLENMARAQLLLLTQGLVPLGGEHASFTKILDAWAAGTDEAKASLTSDQLAKLAQLVAPAAPAHTVFWEAVGAQLTSKSDTLTDAGWTSVETAFSGESGPSFGDKEKLLAALKAKKAKDEEKNKAKSRPKEQDRRDDRRDDRRGDDRRDDRRGSDRRDDRRDDRRGSDRRDDRDRGRDDRRDDRRDRDRRSRSRGDRRR